jgi:NAD(P)-dependent dehydrogenase (short-subunit alcohol dehydrogenase family)
MDLALEEKNVLVTGGSKGIGLATAELFAAEGANVAICARNGNEVAKVAKALAAKGVRAWGQRIDVADPAALKGWVEGAAADIGGIDCIVCNVSAIAVGDTAETWEKSFRTDMMHAVHAIAAARRRPSVYLIPGNLIGMCRAPLTTFGPPSGYWAVSVT